MEQNAYIRTAINLPAQSFYQTLPGLLVLLSRIPVVVFHCQSCTATGRGARTAAYYQDALDAAGVTTSEGRVLTGGIKAWVEEFGADQELTVAL